MGTENQYDDHHDHDHDHDCDKPCRPRHRDCCKDDNRDDDKDHDKCEYREHYKYREYWKVRDCDDDKHEHGGKRGRGHDKYERDDDKRGRDYDKHDRDDDKKEHEYRSHHLHELEKTIKSLADSLAGLGRGAHLLELQRIIHWPGWTTPAELAFVNASSTTSAWKCVRSSACRPTSSKPPARSRSTVIDPAAPRRSGLRAAFSWRGRTVRKVAAFTLKPKPRLPGGRDAIALPGGKLRRA